MVDDRHARQGGTRCARAIVLVLGFLALAMPTAAQTYPAKLIRIVVPLPPGGSNDLAARLVAERMAAVASVIGAINSLLPHVKTGRLRMLATAGARRASLLPDVPTIAD